METHGVGKQLFNVCGCRFVRKRSCAAECKEERAADCILFLVKAMQLAPWILSAHVG